MPDLLQRSMLLGSGSGVRVNAPQHDGHTPFHQHDFHELALVVAGNGLHRGVLSSGPAARGLLVLLAPGQWHAWEKCEGLRLYNICLGEDALSVLRPLLAWAGGLDAHLFPHGQDLWQTTLDSPSTQRAQDAAQRLHRVQKQQDPQARVEQAALALALLAHLAGQAQAAAASHAPRASETHSIDLDILAKAMSADLAYNWGLVQLARQAKCTPSHLVRRWHARFGLAPLAWLARRRAERAALLLLTSSHSIAAIGASVGWPDPNYCARRFRQLFGCTPGAYRKQQALPNSSQVPAWVQWD